MSVFDYKDSYDIAQDKFKELLNKGRRFYFRNKKYIIVGFDEYHMKVEAVLNEENSEEKKNIPVSSRDMKQILKDIVPLRNRKKK